MRAGRHRKPKITLPEYAGDHGPQTAAQTRGTVMEAIEGDKNNMGRRHRFDWLKAYHTGHHWQVKGQRGRIHPFLSMRQYQAGLAIRNAWEATMKSPAQTGERVDSSPKPDQRTAIQVTANLKYARTVDAVPRNMRYIVEHVCQNNQPIAEAKVAGMHRANLQVALDLVANRIGY